MSKIAYLEVDRDDESLVLEKFPDAIVFSNTVQGQRVINALNDVTVISCFIYSKFDEETILRLPKLKLLCTRSVGTDHIDLMACNAQGITVCHVPDYGSHVIAEHVFALILGTLRHIHIADERVESGKFDYHGLRGIALKGKRIGIVGTGRIGSFVAKIASGFGMKIQATDLIQSPGLVEQNHVKYVSLQELLSSNDIVTLHLPATKETYHLLDAQAFKRMKKGMILVNTARGEVVDSKALLTALKAGTVAHALLDVMEHEKNFEANRELIEHPRVITTPHIAFYADDSMRNMYEDCFASIVQWLEGKQPAHTLSLPG